MWSSAQKNERKTEKEKVQRNKIKKNELPRKIRRVKQCVSKKIKKMESSNLMEHQWRESAKFSHYDVTSSNSQSDLKIALIVSQFDNVETIWMFYEINFSQSNYIAVSYTDVEIIELLKGTKHNISWLICWVETKETIKGHPEWNTEVVNLMNSASWW